MSQVRPLAASLNTLIVHRMLSVLAGGSVLMMLVSPWQQTVTTHPTVGVLITFSFVVMLGLIVVAFAARSQRLLGLVDLAVLAVSVAATAVIAAPYVDTRHTQLTDEGILLDRATRALAAGHNPYRHTFEHLVAANPTPLMNGRIADRFGYPPLTPLLAAGLNRLFPGVHHPTVLLGVLCVFATAAIVFVALPAWARPLAVLITLTVSEIPRIGISGFAAAPAAPLLILAVVRWTAIGRRGRLRWPGVVKALALGAACCATQQAWFVVPFLAVAIWRVRRGELARRPAALVMARYVALVLALPVLLDLPFVIVTPRRWVGGVLDPLRQHAIFFGPGLFNLQVRLIGGGGDLGLYSLMALLLVIASLVAMAAFPRQLAVAAPLLPFVIFWFSLRSQATYWELGAPIALIGLVTADRRALDAARPVWTRARIALPTVLRARVLAPGVLVVAAVAALIGALVSPAPLHLAVREAVHARRGHKGLTELVVAVRNTSTRAVEPHFLTTVLYTQSLFWTVVSGPRSLAPGGQATYRLEPSPLEPYAVPRVATLWVVSDGPETVSSTPVGHSVPAPLRHRVHRVSGSHRRRQSRTGRRLTTSGGRRPTG